MYRLAYEESQRSLDDQRDELNGIRDRSVNFVAFVGAATAFLVGIGLHTANADRDAIYFVLAGAGTAGSLHLLVEVFLLLRPSSSNPWQYRLSGGSLISGWIESDVPAPDLAQFLRALAEINDSMRASNERLLRGVRNCYRRLVLGGSAQLIVWAVLVWLRG
jgi:hypothetical protein